MRYCAAPDAARVMSESDGVGMPNISRSNDWWTPRPAFLTAWKTCCCRLTTGLVGSATGILNSCSRHEGQVFSPGISSHSAMHFLSKICWQGVLTGSLSASEQTVQFRSSPVRVASVVAETGTSPFARKLARVVKFGIFGRLMRLIPFGLLCIPSDLW